MAVSGTAVIGIAVSGAVALLITLLRREDRFEAMESAEHEAEHPEAPPEQ